MSILIVDDDTSIRDLLTLFLQHNGYTTTTARNGRDALDSLRESAVPPRLILLDLMMPVMSGAEFRIAQQQDPALATIPVVVISAAQNLGDKAPILHADAYLPKPIDFTILLEIVHRFHNISREHNR